MGYQEDFVKQMLPYAVAVGDQYGLDPITIITQAVQETGWGQEVAGNNYFGVKSHGRPGGRKVTTHEDYGNGLVKEVHDFRQYGSMYESVEDYAQFLRDNPRYANAFKVQGYDNQLKAIAAGGYATDQNYSTKLIQVANSVKRRVGPLPPGSIPNVVGTQLDVANPGGIDLTKLLKEAPTPRARFEGDAARAKRASQAPKPASPEQRIKAEMNEVAKQALASKQYPPRKLPAIPNAVNQGFTYAGQETGPVKVAKTTPKTGKTGIQIQREEQLAIKKSTPTQAKPATVKPSAPKPLPNLDRIAETLPGGSNPKSLGFSYANEGVKMPKAQSAKPAAVKPSTVKPTGSTNQNLNEQRAEQNAQRRASKPVTALEATQDAVATGQANRKQQAPKPQVAAPQVSTQLSAKPPKKEQQPEFNLMSVLGLDTADPLGLNSMFSSIDSMFSGNGQGGGLFGNKKSQKLTQSQIAAAQADSKNHNGAALAAISKGNKSYTAGGGVLMPTTAMNGNVRNTYGDEQGGNGSISSI